MFQAYFLTIIVVLVQQSFYSIVAKADEPQNPGTVVISRCTKIPIVLQGPVDSRLVKEGDQIVARASQDIFVEGRVCISKGASITGLVSKVQHLHKCDAITFVFNRLSLPSGHTADMSAILDKKGRLQITRREQPIFFDCATRMGWTMLGLTPAESMRSTTVISPKGAALELQANDELTLMLTEDVRD